MVTERQILAKAAYAAIKINILNLSYAPGSHLSEAGLAAGLGLGRMPVRLALKRLKSEGWLSAEFRCRIKVKDITAKDISEISKLRRLLEGQALALIFKNGLTWEYSFRLEEKLIKIKAERDDLFARELAVSAWYVEMIKALGNERAERVYGALQEEAVRIALSQARREGAAYIDSVIEGLERFCLALREKRYEEAQKRLMIDD
jgi:DNA-binding GntR family transcriptional regulator